MAARTTHYAACAVRARPTALPLPPAHRGPTLSSLIWSLSTPSASLPHHAAAVRTTPTLAHVQRRGMASMSKRKSTLDQLSEEDQLASFHRAVRDEYHGAIDMWNMPMETLDVHLPSFPARVKNATWRDHLELLRDNILNSIKNAASMRKLAQENAFPGRETASARSLEIFRAASTKDSAWVAPLRALLLENYTRVHAAIAEGDAKTVRALTVDQYAKDAARQLRTLHPPGGAAAWRWRLVGAPAPVRILSVRATEGYAGLAPLRAGHPLYINVLARFETTQLLARRGAPSGAQPRRVVEHLLFEKRGWYDTPWAIKEQMHVDR
ncbi:hypothetical protein BC834DRAFT_824172 [Gloeopeniophorella convolvens]|nr:hypothetical protein BC834DRAFT_824172 [Gloeopeniophorella convolvens]